MNSNKRWNQGKKSSRWLRGWMRGEKNLKASRSLWKLRKSSAIPSRSTAQTTNSNPVSQAKRKSFSKALSKKHRVCGSFLTKALFEWAPAKRKIRNEMNQATASDYLKIIKTATLQSKRLIQTFQTNYFSTAQSTSQTKAHKTNIWTNSPTASFATKRQSSSSEPWKTQTFHRTFRAELKVEMTNRNSETSRNKLLKDCGS